MPSVIIYSLSSSQAKLQSHLQNLLTMPKKFLRKHLPDPHKITQSRSLRIFGSLLHDPNLWHMNRKSVSLAFLVGFFFMWVPLPSQMILAAGVAIIIRCNLPLAVALVWITNPLTMGPMFYFAYKLGNWMLNLPVNDIEFEASFDWISSQMNLIWKPFLLGCLTMGTVSGLTGFTMMRLLWRLHIVQYLKDKKRRFSQRFDK